MIKAEYKLQRQIVQVIRGEGGYAIRTNPPGVENGTPDILGCFAGRGLALEVKMPEASPGCTTGGLGEREVGWAVKGASRLQIHRLLAWEAGGAVVGVVCSVAEVVNILERMRVAA